MAPVPPAVFDPQRLQILDDYDILDTGPEPGFDDIVMLARQICKTPIALVSLVETNRQWFKATSGLGLCETPIEQSVCAHALAQPQTLNIPDLTLDARTRDNTLVTGEPFIRFYAGAPLITASGHAIGTICVIDTLARPGGLTAEQIIALEALSRQVVTLLDQRRLLILYEDRAREVMIEADDRKAAETAQKISDDRYRTLFNSLDAAFCLIEVAFDASGLVTDYRFIEVNQAFTRQTGLTHAAGQWMRDIAPAHDQYWFDIYGRVATTGEAARFESQAVTPDNRWFDVHAFRVGEPGSHQVAILFNDISVRKNAETQQKMLNDELGHRMKNSITLVQAIATQTLRSAGDKEAVRAFTSRLRALGNAHDILLQQSWSSASLRDVIAGVTTAQADASCFDISGPDIRLEPRAALSLSLLFHELSTNAVKYGSLSIPAGRVEVSWSKTDQDLTLKWIEKDGPYVSKPAHVGLGSRLIDVGIVGTSKVVKSYDPSGFKVEFRAPLKLIDSEAIH